MIFAGEMTIYRIVLGNVCFSEKILGHCNYQLFPFILFYSRKLNYLCKFKGNFGIFPLLSIVSYFQMMGMFSRLGKDISIPIIPCPVDDSFFLTFLFKTSEIGSWTIESFTCNYPTPWLVV